MRVAPLGDYFANDLERCVHEARASSVVTYAHGEGVAGAIAVAVAAAMAWQLKSETNCAQRFFEAVLQWTPESQVRRGILLASTIAAETRLADAGRALGNGSLVTAPDTVPFCLWMSAHHLGRFVEALGNTISVGGDCDTNVAIVVGIVALLNHLRLSILRRLEKNRHAVLIGAIHGNPQSQQFFEESKISVVPGQNKGRDAPFRASLHIL